MTSEEADRKGLEHRFNFLLRAAPIALMEIDVDGVIQSVVGSGLEILGRSQNDAKGLNFFERNSGNTEAILAARKALEGRKSSAFIVYLNGAYELHFEPLLDESGRIKGAIGLSLLLSDRERFREDLYCRQMANWMPQIVWTARPDGSIDYYNDRWYEFTGFSRNQFEDEGRSRVLAQEDHHRWLETWRSAVETGAPYEIEYRFFDRRFGGFRWFLGRAVPVKNDAGDVVRWYGTCTDIHEQKILLEELRSALKEKSKLETNERAAVAASEMKSQFLANMSHEIRTPLNGIVGLLDLIQQTKLSKTQAQYVSLLDESVAHLSHLVNEILDFSKIESNRLQLEDGRVDVGRLTQDVFRVCKQMAAKKKIRFRASIPKDCEIEIAGDPIRIKQVLLNLVQNAIKFTETGTVEIRALRERQGKGEWLRLEVRDTGIGIEPPALETIFDPFVQADASVTRRYGGTGLGLSISQKLVHLMGGAIGVRSAVGRGSSFWFSIPLFDEATRPARGRSSSRKAKLARLASAKPLDVLVAEDNVINQKVVSQLLKAFGHRPTVVEDGRQAVAAVATGSYDLVLMDCHMPVMDGLSATREIRSLDGNRGQTPIIALTADVFAETHERCRQAGMDGLLGKPIDIEALFQVLESKGRERSGARPPGGAQAAPKILEGERLAQLRALKGGHRLVDDLIKDFIRNAPALLAEIQEALRAQNFEEAFRPAHVLKAGAGALGAMHVQSEAAAVERAAKARDLNQALKGLEALKPCLASSIDALNRAALRAKRAG